MAAAGREKCRDDVGRRYLRWTLERIDSGNGDNNSLYQTKGRSCKDRAIPVM